jgi:uncharacterized metal-binding protein YceD (DUF177 family)
LNETHDIAPEFSRPLAIDDIAREGSDLTLEATAEERRRLAERFGLLSLDRLTAALTVTRGASGIPVRVRGRLHASVVQECVVSLEPIPSEIDELIEVEFAPAAEDGAEEVFHLDQPEPPEPLEGDSLDLGELVAQHLSVALDPYPRKEGLAPLEWAAGGPEDGEDEADSPFSVLAPLRKKGS